jgi:hypothetical protein
MPAINPIAVVAAVVVAMVIGAIYYMPALMGNRMMALTKVYVERSPGQAMALQVVLSLVAMLALTVLVQLAGARGPAAGATVGFWAWLLLAFADAGATNFSGRPWSLWLLSQVNWLITFLAAGAVIGFFSQ